MTPPKDPLPSRKFETASIKSLGDDYQKRAKAALESRNPSPKSEENIKDNAPPTPQAMTSENYRQIYEQQKTYNIETAKKNAQAIGGSQNEMAAKERIQKENAEKAFLENKRANDFRFRARELQNKIQWWKQQKGMGQYDDTVINGTLYTLEQELNGIPPAFWT